MKQEPKPTITRDGNYVIIRDTDNFVLRIRNDVWQRILANSISTDTHDLAKALWLNAYYSNSGVMLAGNGYFIETATDRFYRDIEDTVVSLTMSYDGRELMQSVLSALREEQHRMKFENTQDEFDSEARTW